MLGVGIPIQKNKMIMNFANKKYIILNGTSDYFTFDAPIEFADGTAWALSWWMKLDENDTSYKTLLGEEYTSGAYSRIMTYSGDKLVIATKNNTIHTFGVGSSIIPAGGDWHFYTLNVKANRDLELYVDGILKETYNYSETQFKFKVIGQNGANNYFFEGQIDEMIFWNGNLTSSDIALLYGGYNALRFAGNYKQVSISPLYAYRFEGNLKDSKSGNNLTAGDNTQYKDVEYYFKVVQDYPHGNTGLATDGQYLYVVHYSSDLSASGIRKYKTDGTFVSEIDTSSVLMKPQGIAYDDSDGTFWVWAYDTSGSNPKMYHINASGNEITTGTRVSFTLPNDPPPNAGVDIHPITGYLWVRSGGESGSQNKVQVFNLNTGTRVYTADVDGFSILYAGEGLWIDRANTTSSKTYFYIHSAHYDGSNTASEFKYMSVDSSYGNLDEIQTINSPINREPYNDRYTCFYYSSAYTVYAWCEGMVIIGGKMYFNSDNGIHGRVPDGNRCWRLTV